MVAIKVNDLVPSTNHSLQPAELYLSRVSLFLILAVVIGCTRTEYPNATYPVSGRVQTTDGESASYVRVTLHSSELVSEGDPFRPSAMTDDDGTFQLTTYETDDGAPQGNYAVTFRWAKPQKTLFDPIPKDRLRNRFALPTENSLRCTIIEAESQNLGTFEIDTTKLTIERVQP